MKRLIPLLIFALLLSGCGQIPPPNRNDPPETTQSPTAASTVPAPETTAPPDPVDLLIAGMTTAEKVGQLFIAAPKQLLTQADPITAMSDDLAAALEQYPVGGIILFADNILAPDQLIALNRAIREACPIAPFLAVDEEGGTVARLGKHPEFDVPTYKNAASVGASGNPEDALAMGRTIGAYLAEYGFNLDFAPVADVNTNPDNPVIGKRAFSDQPETAAAMAAAFARGLKENGVIATFKHFPGHGDTGEDSHTGLAVVYKTAEELESCEFLPFLEAGRRDMVMVAHVALPNVTGDMTPATLSPAIVTGILKEQLMFEGLVITDAMEMGAITEAYPSGTAAVAALRAGCHIILMPENLPEAFDAVIAALEEGTLSIDWLDETLRRILEFKELHGIL